MSLDQTTLAGSDWRHLTVRADLSKRQDEILRAACVGTPDKLIAAQLQVSTRTLEGHWRAIHRKLGSVNRCQAGFLFAAMRDHPPDNFRG